MIVIVDNMVDILIILIVDNMVTRKIKAFLVGICSWGRWSG